MVARSRMMPEFEALNPADAAALLKQGGTLCIRLGREDLAGVLATAANRIARPETVIAVVGEFKQGKSSLVNGLLGDAICPVDDDIATAVITLLRYATETRVRFHYRDGDDERVEEGTLGDLHATVVEHNASAPSATLAEVSLANPFLVGGLAIVDTPGVGGLNPGYISMTLAFVRSADALLFVSDVSAPLTFMELEFLRRARERCPVVVAVMPKADLYPEWRRVVEIAGRQLTDAGQPTSIYPVSNPLRMRAFETRRTDLNQESGYPALLEDLNTNVLGPSTAAAYSRAMDDLRRALEQLAVTAQSEMDGLEDPATWDSRLAELNRARRRFEHLRSSGARWTTVMNDGFADLVGEVEHTFRGALRELARDVEERIEREDPSKTWESMTAEVRDRVAAAAETMVVGLESGAAGIGNNILELLKEEEDVAIGALSRSSVQPDVASLWLGKGIPEPSLASAAGTGYAGLRGAQGGILVFAMLANLAGIALTTMALAGIGIVFGGKQLFDERRRQVSTRRQQARTTIRQFLDDVQFQVSKDMRDLSRELQRRVRDHFAERIGELTRTYAEAADSLQKGTRKEEGEREERLAALKNTMESINGLRAHTGASAATP